MTIDTYTVTQAGIWNETADDIQYNNLLGIRNHSGYLVEIRSISFVPLQSADLNVDVSPQLLHRITALASGETVSPFKNDTSNSSLPSQVIARAHGVVTTSGVLRQFGVAYGQRVTPTNVIWAQHGPGRLGGGVIQSWVRTADQRVVLREGEGFAWLQTSTTLPRTQEAVFVVRNASSGATYSYRVTDTPITDNDVMFALLNGSGSGVVLELISADILDVGLQAYAVISPWTSEAGDSFPSFRIIRARSIEAGETVAVTKRDSTSPDLPEDVAVIRGGRVETALPTMQATAQQLEWARALQDTMAMRLLDQQQVGLIRFIARDANEAWAPGSTTFPHRLSGVTRELLGSKAGMSSLQLRRGEALSIAHHAFTRHIIASGGSSYGYGLQDGPVTGMKYNLEIEFTVEASGGDNAEVVPIAGATYVS